MIPIIVGIVFLFMVVDSPRATPLVLPMERPLAPLLGLLLAAGFGKLLFAGSDFLQRRFFLEFRKLYFYQVRD